ncbi:Arc family DNA-binding protein [Enterobacter asburiae]|uniref:Arc family DNA-binding protein n=1 Tax=Enterobacter asburiae TaxID=61645 RepID=UPI00064A362B|nr:Arc family DNA-binding protein [Enterobacter asburiae]KLP86861.1 transcriptional regulator [Enterobacter asburiae]
MSEVIYSGRKTYSFQLRLPECMKEEIRKLAEMDGISINSAIVQRLAKSLREERANGQ